MDLSGREILVVEDIRFTRLTIVRMLSQMGGPKVHEAEDGAVALDVLAAHGQTIDCVLTDFDMPNVDGLQLLQAVRVGTAAIPRDLKVVGLTGRTELDRLGPALLLDIDGIIAKPTSKQTLESTLIRLFGSRAPVTLADAAVYRSVDIAPPTEASVPAARDVHSDPDEVAERQVSLTAVGSESRLSRDLMFENGRLLLRAGTALSERMIVGLRELVAVAGLPDDIWIIA